MRNILLDTGAFVALLDRDEKNHDRCLSFFQGFKGNVLTTEPVLTETLYLLNQSFRNQKTCIEFILKGGAALVPQSPESLSQVLAFMEKYKDIPMDFADATLVVLAEEAGIEEVFTLDRKGFSAYRMFGKKTFKICPS
jgi:predicted nucleic acid-binding protein